MCSKICHKKEEHTHEDKKMSDNDSVSDASNFRDMFAPWREAFGSRVLTCSPVAKGHIICMDMDCNLHGRDDRGRAQGHTEYRKATPLELVVINSFSGINPREVVGSNEFVGWTESEIHFACYGTDDVAETQRRMFYNQATHEKLKTYVSMFEGAAEVFNRSYEILQEDTAASLTNCVREWSGAMNPLLFLWCMKGRNDKMASKIVRLKNTVLIWKDEAEKAKRENAQLKWKLKHLKKTSFQC